MRPAFLVFAVLPLAAFAPRAEQPTFHVAKGAKLVKTFEQTSKLALEDMRVSFGEEEVPKEQLGDFELTIESTSKVVITDEYVALGDGRPAVLRRNFDELAGRQTRTATGEEGPEEDVQDRESELEGKLVVFTWSDETQDYAKKFEGDGGDDELLDGLVEDCDLREFLPGKDVAEDDTWDVDAKRFDTLWNPAGNVALASDEDDEDSAAIDALLRENLAGTIKATFKGVRDEGGVKLAVIALDIEVHATAETSSDEDGASSHKTYAVEYDLEGEILWDMAAGRPYAASFSGREQVTIGDRMDHDADGEVFSIDQTMVLGGDTQITATYAAAE